MTKKHFIKLAEYAVRVGLTPTLDKHQRELALLVQRHRCERGIR